MKEKKESITKIKSNNKKILITAKIKPNSQKNSYCGMIDNNIHKFKIAAPPVDNKANNALILFLAEMYGTSKSNIKILSGETSSIKRIEISNAKTEYIQQNE